MNEPVIEITLAMYEQLCKDSWKLQCLQNAGVDNWEGYDDALVEDNSDD